MNALEPSFGGPGPVGHFYLRDFFYPVFSKHYHAIQASWDQFVLWNFFFSSPGNKPTRRRTNNKLLAPSTDSGRSPLSTLQNDNSPKALASLQVMICTVAEGVGRGNARNAKGAFPLPLIIHRPTDSSSTFLAFVPGVPGSTLAFQALM